MYRYFNRVSGVGSGNYVYSWKSKGLSDEDITAPATSDYKLNPELRLLVQLVWIKILISMSENILDMELDLINMDFIDT